jgi:hypothetical protein
MLLRPWNTRLCALKLTLHHAVGEGHDIAFARCRKLDDRPSDLLSAFFIGGEPEYKGGGGECLIHNFDLFGTESCPLQETDYFHEVVPELPGAHMGSIQPPTRVRGRVPHRLPSRQGPQTKGMSRTLPAAPSARPAGVARRHDAGKSREPQARAFRTSHLPGTRGPPPIPFGRAVSAWGAGWHPWPGYEGTDTRPAGDTFLGDTDPSSKPTLGVSRADEMLGRHPGLALNAALGSTRMRPAECPDRRRLPEGGHCGREFDVIR